MKKKFLQFFLLSVVFYIPAAAQDFSVETHRTIDGTQNNLANPDWGAAGVNLLRLTKEAYADGISAPGGSQNGPNPRNISNTLFDQPNPIPDPLNLSDYVWVFGQFIDHDLGLTPDGNEPAFIEVPAGDPWFDPQREGRAIIPMMRNVFGAGTGDSQENPRQHPNMITAFIDGSAVYGSSEEMAAWLRTFESGKLKVSAGNLLPYNTIDGEFESAIDSTAPHMDNPTGISEKIFVAGDARANENPLLLTMHNIFVREHNRLCDELSVQNPTWSDEALYQHARKLVGGLIQSVLYNEWLPTIGVQLDPYQGYSEAVNPGISNVFTAAAYRMGHTLLSPNLLRLDENRASIEQGSLGLRDAFFNPITVPLTGGLDPFIRGMGVQVQQQFDAKLVSDVRNFLFGVPGAGGLDLASININRGRERGLPDFNSVRQSFGLRPYRHLAQVNADLNVYARLLILYTTINGVDPWVGMLSETPLRGALFGETVMAIMKQQFGALRDGDRFFYLNDPVLSQEEKDWITHSTLGEILVRNSGVEKMQHNVFRAGLPEDCDPMDLEVSVMTEAGVPIPETNAVLAMENGLNEAEVTNESGDLSFDEVPSCAITALAINKNDSYTNGLTTLDIIITQKHILGVRHLDSPYKMLAADVNQSGSITTLDVIRMRKVILGVESDFGLAGSIWRFIPADYQFADPDKPFDADMPENLMNFNGRPSDAYTFVGVKAGDVNQSADLSSVDNSVETRNNEVVSVNVQDIAFETGETIEIPFEVKQLQLINGYQFGIKYDLTALQLLDYYTVDIPSLDKNNFASFEERGILTTSWNVNQTIPSNEGRFVLQFLAKEPGKVSEVIALNQHITQGVAYDLDDREYSIEFAFDASNQPLTTNGFKVYQNQPNPFNNQTVVSLELPEQSWIHLNVYDVSGKLLLNQQQEGVPGLNNIVIEGDRFKFSGTLVYEVTTQFGTFSRKMIKE